MGWINKSAQRDYTKLQLAEGETFEGVYTGTDTINGANGAFEAHGLEGEDGITYSATGASLNNQFADVEPDSKVRITYDGLKSTKTPGRTVKAYTVAVYVEDAKSADKPAGRGAAV